MANKPPAFQFYAKDWRSSPTVRSMSIEEQGIYIALLALAWDSDIPGTITLKPQEICREIGIYSATFRRFLRKFPATFRRVGGNLVQPKLDLQRVKYLEIQQKRSASAVQMHMQKGGSAFALAPAGAPAGIKTRAQCARDLRLAKELETKRELAVGAFLPFPSEVSKGGNVRKDYLKFLDLRNTGRISRDVMWSKWEPLSEAERKRLLEKPGPVTVGHLEDLEKQKA